jgi:hypothetical protein
MLCQSKKIGYNVFAASAVTICRRGGSSPLARTINPKRFSPRIASRRAASRASFPVGHTARGTPRGQICPGSSGYGSIRRRLTGPRPFGHLPGIPAMRPVAQCSSCRLRLRSHSASVALGVAARGSEVPSPIGLRRARPHKFASRDGAGRASATTASAKGGQPATARHAPTAGVLRATAGRARPLAHSTAPNRFSAL